MINATVSHANTSFFKSIILDQIIFHRVWHFARYFLPCLPLFLFHIQWTLYHDKFSTVFKTLQDLLFFHYVCHFAFFAFFHIECTDQDVFYRLTSSSMCHHSSMYSLYLIVAVSAMIEWRFWFPKKKKKKITGDKFTNVVIYPNGCWDLI